MDIKLQKNDLKLFGKLLFKHGSELRESLLEKMDASTRVEYERAMDLLATVDEAMFEKKKQIRKKRTKKVDAHVIDAASKASANAAHQSAS